MIDCPIIGSNESGPHADMLQGTSGTESYETMKQNKRLFFLLKCLYWVCCDSVTNLVNIKLVVGKVVVVPKLTM
jgi:hypothetical protein